MRELGRHNWDLYANRKSRWKRRGVLPLVVWRRRDPRCATAVVRFVNRSKVKATLKVSRLVASVCRSLGRLTSFLAFRRSVVSRQSFQKFSSKWIFVWHSHIPTAVLCIHIWKMEATSRFPTFAVDAPTFCVSYHTISSFNSKQKKQPKATGKNLCSQNFLRTEQKICVTGIFPEQPKILKKIKARI